MAKEPTKPQVDKAKLALEPWDAQAQERAATVDPTALQTALTTQTPPVIAMCQAETTHDDGAPHEEPSP